MSHDRVFGCICRDDGGAKIVAVLALDHALASEILARRDEFLDAKARGTGIVEVTFEATAVRFFHERLSEGPGVEDFRAAVGARLDAEPATRASWVDLGDIAVPDGDDCDMAYAHLHIAQTYIFIEAIGKHAEAPFTTAVLPCALLRAVAAEGAPSEVTGNHETAASSEAVRAAASITFGGPSPPTPAQVRAYIDDAGQRCPFCGHDIIEGDNVEIDGGVAWQPMTCNRCNAEWNDIYYLAAVGHRYNAGGNYDVVEPAPAASDEDRDDD